MFSVRSVAAGKPIRYQVQSDVVLEKRFCPGKHQRKSPRRIERLLYNLIAISAKPTVGDTDKSRVIRSRTENPLDRRRCVTCFPFDHYSLVLFDRFHADL